MASGIRVKTPSLQQFRQFTRAAVRQLAASGGYAADKATKIGKARIRQKMQGSGLGRLGQGIRSQTSLERSKNPNSFNWGVLYIANGEKSRTGQAIEAYSNGVLIRAQRRKWLAFPTDRIPQRVNRRKITPALYNASGLAASIGPLRFVPVSGRKAYLVVDNVRVSLKNGRARRGGRRSKTLRKKPVIVAFVLIRATYRGRRFLPGAILAAQQKQIAAYAAEYLGRGARRAT